MAIDTSMFAAKIPAATYTLGDRLDLICVRGPSVVRDGYGSAQLKRVTALMSSGGTTAWEIHVKNGNWVDELVNVAAGAGATALSNTSSGIQPGHDASLHANSGWQVYGVCILAGTESANKDLTTLIDVDYAGVPSVANPRTAVGVPCTNTLDMTVANTAEGASETPVWNSVNVDILKAGYKYLLTELMFRAAVGPTGFGFISISGAAGQSGLERIVPVVANSYSALRYSIDYATPLQKGPMNINVMFFGSGSTNAHIHIDWVKK